MQVHYMTSAKVAVLAVLITMTAATLAVVDLLDVAFAVKNPQSECITGQNEGFIGKEQSGDAYKTSKDACQQLSK